MKKVIFVAAMFFAAVAAYAQPDFSQLRFDLGGNYTQFKGDFRQKAAGIKLKASVPFNERMSAGLSFTYHMPIKVASEVTLTNGGSTASEMAFNFKTIGLDANYNFTDEA